jgi:hypothetical protein
MPRTRPDTEPETFDEAAERVHRAFCDPEHELVSYWDAGMAEALRRNGYEIVKAIDYEQMRMDRSWPTPMHRTADALDQLTHAHYGDVLRWFADLADASLDARKQAIGSMQTPAGWRPVPRAGGCWSDSMHADRHDAGLIAPVLALLGMGVAALAFLLARRIVR